MSKESDRSRERTLAEVTREAEESELAHMMQCRNDGCKRCEDSTPPIVKARRYLAG